MKADLTRATFDARKHYAGVVHQQQRVVLDADLNEQGAIARHRVERGAADALGPCAAPIDPASGAASGFELKANAAQDSLTVGAGDLYVDGILCENEGAGGGAVPVHAQLDLPPNASPIVPGPGLPLPLPRAGLPPATKLVSLDAQGNAVAPQDGLYVGFVDVWRRHVTALEDDSIREVALGGPDTTTRLKTIAQVKLLRVDPDANHPASCAAPPKPWVDHVASFQPTGKLAAQAEPTQPPKGPCVIAPKAGYRRLENQLYRVEIHQGGTLPGGVKYKWSRDNGSIVVRCVKGQPPGTDVKVTTLGRDAVLNVGAGEWVELIDDTHELLGLPGQLLEVQKAQDDVVTTKSAANLPDFPDNPRLRRWDGVEDATTAWKLLEDGIEVKFEAGTYQVGDHWLIPARTATGDVEWPRSGGNPVSQPRHGGAHHMCCLALLRCAGGKWSVVEDCRPKFPAATDLVNAFYAGGDGQEATPDPLQPAQRISLVQPLRVGVANGQWPVAGASVRFTITGGDGRLQGFANKDPADALTNANGIAECAWALDDSTAVQTVEAALLEGGQPTAQHLPLRFTAQLSRAQDVSYDPVRCDVLKQAGANTVQKAIDRLCTIGRGGGCCRITVGVGGEYRTIGEAFRAVIDMKLTDVCVCLLAGEHSTEDWVPPEGWDAGLVRRTHLVVSGCGPASRIVAAKSPVRFGGFLSVTLYALDVIGRDLSPLVQFQDCAEVILDEVNVFAVTQPHAAVAIAGAHTYRFERCSVEAYTHDAVARPGQLLGRFEIAAKLFDTAGELATPWQPRAFEAAPDLVAKQPPEVRLALAARVGKALADLNTEGKIGPAELGAALRFVDAYGRQQVDPGEVVAALVGMRPAIAQDHPALALEATPTIGDAALRSSRFVGTVSLDGIGGKVLRDEDFAAQAKALRKRFGSETGVLQLVQNGFDSLLVGLGVIERKQPKSSVTRLYRRALVDGNVFGGAAFQLLCAHAHLGANLFDRPRERAALGAATAVVMGNSDPFGDGVLIHVAAVGINATGNVGLDVVAG